MRAHGRERGRSWPRRARCVTIGADARAWARARAFVAQTRAVRDDRRGWRGHGRELERGGRRAQAVQGHLRGGRHGALMKRAMTNALVRSYAECSGGSWTCQRLAAPGTASAREGVGGGACGAGAGPCELPAPGAEGRSCPCRGVKTDVRQASPAPGAERRSCPLQRGKDRGSATAGAPLRAYGLRRPGPREPSAVHDDGEPHTYARTSGSSSENLPPASSVPASG